MNKLITKISKYTELDETDVIAGVTFVACMIIAFLAISRSNG